jgi:hypothetical protein
VWRGCGIQSGRIEWMRRVAPLQDWETYMKPVPGRCPGLGDGRAVGAATG